MSTIKVNVAGLSGSFELELDPANATAGGLREAAAAAGNDIEGLALRANGETVDDSYPVSDDSVFVTAPPAAKHG